MGWNWFFKAILLDEHHLVYNGRWPLAEDDFWWKTTFDEWRPLMNDDLWWKTPLMEDNLFWKTKFNETNVNRRRFAIELCHTSVRSFFQLPRRCHPLAKCHISPCPPCPISDWSEQTKLYFLALKGVTVNFNIWTLKNFALCLKSQETDFTNHFFSWKLRRIP